MLNVWSVWYMYEELASKLDSIFSSMEIECNLGVGVQQLINGNSREFSDDVITIPYPLWAQDLHEDLLHWRCRIPGYQISRNDCFLAMQSWEYSVFTAGDVKCSHSTVVRHYKQPSLTEHPQVCQQRNRPF